MSLLETSATYTQTHIRISIRPTPEFTGNIPFQLLRRFAGEDIQHNRIGDHLRLVGVFLQRRGQRRLRLGQSPQVQLGDGLADDRQRGGGAGRGGQFLVDVEGRLVFLAALDMSFWSVTVAVDRASRFPHERSVGRTLALRTCRTGHGRGGGGTKGQRQRTYDSQPHPRFRQVDQQRILRPALGGLHFFQGEIGSVLVEVDLHD